MSERVSADPSATNGLVVQQQENTTTKQDNISTFCKSGVQLGESANNSCCNKTSKNSTENVELEIRRMVITNFSSSLEGFSNMPDISKGDEEVHEMASCTGLRFSWLLFFLFWLSVVLSLGIILLFCYWFDWLKDWMVHTRIVRKNNAKHEKYLRDMKEVSHLDIDDDEKNVDIFHATSFEKADAVMVKAKETEQLTVCPIQFKNVQVDHTVLQSIVKTFQTVTKQQQIGNGIADLLSTHNTVTLQLRYFQYRHLIYVYNEETDRFHRVHHYTLFPFSEIHTMAHTTSVNLASNQQERDLKRLIFGINSIETEVRNVVALFLDEVLHPFYIFQVASVAVWLSENYYTYAAAIAVISTLSSIISLWETRTNMIKLKEMTSFHCNVSRLYIPKNTEQASNSWKNVHKHRVDSTELLPGDLIEIDNDMVLPCDCVLLHGQVIMNESMLTGESTPTKKVPIPRSGSEKEAYNCKRDKTHTLFSGTQVIMNKPSALYEGSEDEMVIAMVIQTGFQTAKGKLVLSILHPKPNQFSFYSDSMKFLLFMFLFGIAGISYSLYNQSTKNAPLRDMIISCFDLLTTIVPPALPIAMTATISMAISRLKKRGIYCISPPRINVSGRVNLACFDKTNTLTRDGMDLHGVVRVSEKEGFQRLIKDTDLLQHLDHVNDVLMQVMACCHNLSYVFGKLVGDPLDVKLFEATNWKIHDGHANEGHKAHNNEHLVISSPGNSIIFTVLKIFDFKSSLQRMSVIAQDNKTGDLYYLVKGSAEMLKTLSKEASVPNDFSKVLYKYSHKGYRVLGCAYRKIDYSELLTILNVDKAIDRKAANSMIVKYADQLNREQVESELTFCGLVCMENKLKPETPGVIRKLTETNLRSVVITGDNPYTSICVARKCGMIPKGKTIYLCEWSNEKSVLVDSSINEEGYHQVDDDTIGGNPMKYYLPLYDTIMWRNVDDQNAPLLSSREVVRKNFRSENFELAVVGEIFDSIVYAHKQYVEKVNKKAKAGIGSKIPYIDTENPSILHRILASCHIFARVSPSGKMKVVEEMIKMDYTTVMCGDGSNDVEALKAAHVGISLSEAEASIAAPFTSIQNSIKSVVEVMKEGRASLSSSYGMFKYMALYSLFEFFAAVLIYHQNATIGDTQYLYVDMFIILPIVLLMANSRASQNLRREKPPDSLFSRFVLISLLGQIVWGFGLMLATFFEIMLATPWYKPSPINRDPKDNVVSYETTITYLVMCYTVLNAAVTQSITKPFKRSHLSDNLLYVGLLVGLYGFTIYITIEPSAFFINRFQFINFPLYYKLRLVMYAFAHLVFTYVWEMFLIWRWPVRQPLKGISIYNGLRLVGAVFCCGGKNHWLARILQQLIRREKKKWRPYKQLRENLGISKVRERMSLSVPSHALVKRNYQSYSTHEERTSLLA